MENRWYDTPPATSRWKWKRSWNEAVKKRVGCCPEFSGEVFFVLTSSAIIAENKGNEKCWGRRNNKNSRQKLLIPLPHSWSWAPYALSEHVLLTTCCFSLKTLGKQLNLSERGYPMGKIGLFSTRKLCGKYFPCIYCFTVSPSVLSFELTQLMSSQMPALEWYGALCMLTQKLDVGNAYLISFQPSSFLLSRVFNDEWSFLLVFRVLHGQKVVVGDDYVGGTQPFDTHVSFTFFFCVYFEPWEAIHINRKPLPRITCATDQFMLLPRRDGLGGACRSLRLGRRGKGSNPGASVVSSFLEELVIPARRSDEKGHDLYLQ